MSPEARVETEVGGHRITLSNLDKVLFPETGFTKGNLIDYYARVAPFLLPHLADRAVTFRRYPNGVGGDSFFEKRAPKGAPGWVRTARVRRASSARSRPDGRGGEEIVFAVIDDLATLVWAGNLAAIELHVPLWRVPADGLGPSDPDHLVFDLDPGPGTSIVECCAVATHLVQRLEAEGRGPLVAKTSGSKGLQCYLPLPPGTDADAAREDAHELAKALERDHEDLVVTNMRKDLRRRKVLIDWSQNHPAKTTVAAYSVRARPAPTVSTPVSFDEVAACAKGGDPDWLRFLPDEVLDRVELHGDLMAPLLVRR